MRRQFFALSAGLLALALLAACDASVGPQQQPAGEPPREQAPGVGETIVRDFDAVTLVSVEATAPPVGPTDPVSEYWVEVVYDLQNQRDFPIEVPFMSAGAAIEGVEVTDTYSDSTSIRWSPDAVIPGEKRYQETQLKPGASIRIAVRIPCESEFEVSGPTKVTCQPYGAPGFDFEITAHRQRDR